MNPRRLALAAVAVSALLLMLALVQSPDADIAVAPPARGPAAPPPAAPAQAADRVSGWIATTLERPLFAPDRRPKAVATVSEEQPEESGPGPVPRLAGIVIGRAGKRALFTPQGGDKPVFVGEGAKVAGWHVDAITGEAVILSGPSGKQTVKPKPDPSLQSAAGPEEQPPPVPSENQPPARRQKAPPARRPPRQLPGQPGARHPILHPHESQRGSAFATIALAAFPASGSATPIAPPAPEPR